jgi:hypothetical protein
MKHIHYCTECGNPVLCPALTDGDCPEAFASIVEDICRSCWEQGEEQSSWQIYTQELLTMFAKNEL